MPKRFSLEKFYQIWDNTHGVGIRVGPDRDSTDQVEISAVGGNSETHFGFTSIVVDPEMAIEIATALFAAAQVIQNEDKSDGNLQ